MLRWTLLRASENSWLRIQIPRLRFARGAVLRFMPGEELDTALDACEAFRKQGIANVLTYLGENVRNAGAAEAVADHYTQALDRIREAGLDCHLSVKLTQLGLDIDAEACHRNVRAITARAAELGNIVWIDMEGSAYTDETLDQYEKLRTEFDNVGICLQSCLYRTSKDLKKLLQFNPAIRLVKGAYAEPKSLAYPRKRDVNSSFFRLARELLRHRAVTGGSRPAFATHDQRLIRDIQQTGVSLGLTRDDYEFQMLYGIQRGEQQRLARERYRVRVLICYGEAWYPWFMRRLAERPGNLVFVVRNIVDRSQITKARR